MSILTSGIIATTRGYPQGAPLQANGVARWIQSDLVKQKHLLISVRVGGLCITSGDYPTGTLREQSLTEPSCK